ncbi:hypothetical protein O3P69_010760 [Scylla paramamosain]|uniref:C-type lectin domain-containing protein n=1 Tax=Scylla paramamosain TaxID=85552 RepID=A0AAW0TG11_SCYPA
MFLSDLTSRAGQIRRTRPPRSAADESSGGRPYVSSAQNTSSLRPRRTLAMSPLPPPLPPMVALLALLGAAPLAAAEVSEAVWHRALVSQAQLDAAATSERFQVADEILCAALANAAPWCHLLTHEGTTCVLYDVVVDSLDAAAADAATPCRTRHRNGETPAPATLPPTQPVTCQATPYSSVSLAAVCFVEGAPVSHGTTLEQDCFPAFCWNRAIVPDHAGTVASTCDAPFSQTSAGCVHLYKQPTDWCKARQYCVSLQADLVVVSSEGFAALQEHLDAENPEEGVWVGVRRRKWLDGRVVSQEEWHSSEPNGNTEDCARMQKYSGQSRPVSIIRQTMHCRLILCPVYEAMRQPLL